MIVILLLVASHSTDEADSLNAALTNCLFATARTAHLQFQSVDQFQVTLERSCRGEEASARSAIVSILRGRGVARSAAERQIDETLRNGRAAVIRAYSYGSPNE